MYVITRQDLSYGQQAVQSQHGLAKFIFQHPEIAQTWYHHSNYLGFLSVADEEALLLLKDKAQKNNIKYSVFREPDINNAMTALVLAPGIKSKKICSNLPLALKTNNEK